MLGYRLASLYIPIITIQRRLPSRSQLDDQPGCSLASTRAARVYPTLPGAAVALFLAHHAGHLLPMLVAA